MKSSTNLIINLSASAPYLVRAFHQIAPSEEQYKDYAFNWKYDLQTLRVGTGYLSSSIFFGGNGTEKFKAAMKMERCWHMITASMFTLREADMLRWFPGCKASCNGMITGKF